MAQPKKRNSNKGTFPKIQGSIFSLWLRWIFSIQQISFTFHDLETLMEFEWNIYLIIVSFWHQIMWRYQVFLVYLSWVYFFLLFLFCFLLFLLSFVFLGFFEKSWKGNKDLIIHILCTWLSYFILADNSNHSKYFRNR